MKSIVYNVRISPKKLDVVASIVRGRPAKDALDLLRFMPNKGANILYKALASAVANAEHNDMQKLEDLSLGQLVVTKGIVYRRGQSISRGRSHPILKRTSTVRIELAVK